MVFPGGFPFICGMLCFVSSHTNGFVSMGSFLTFDGLTKSLLVCYIFLTFRASKQFALFIFLQFSFSIYLLWNTQVFYNYNQRKFAFVILQTTKSLFNWFSLFSPGWRGAHYVYQVCNTFKEICMLLSFK